MTELELTTAAAVLCAAYDSLALEPNTAEVRLDVVIWRVAPRATRDAIYGALAELRRSPCLNACSREDALEALGELAAVAQRRVGKQSWVDDELHCPVRCLHGRAGCRTPSWRKP